MHDDDEYGEENELKKVLNKFAQKVQKKTAKNSYETLQTSYYKKNNHINQLDNFTVNCLIR